MNVEVIIGRHVDDDAHRRAAFDWVARWYTARGYPVRVGTATTSPWCKAEAYNPAVAASDAEVVVLADADSFVATAVLDRAIDACTTMPWACPFSRVRRLTAHATDALLTCDPATVEIPPVGDLHSDVHDCLPGGGIVVMRRDVAVRCGPFDAKFRGHGGEDYALGNVARTFTGEYAVGFTAPLWHLWHPPGAPAPDGHAARRLINDYRRAKFDVAATQALLEAPWTSTSSSRSPAPTTSG